MQWLSVCLTQRTHSQTPNPRHGLAPRRGRRHRLRGAGQVPEPEVRCGGCPAAAYPGGTVPAEPAAVRRLCRPFRPGRPGIAWFAHHSGQLAAWVPDCGPRALTRGRGVCRPLGQGAYGIVVGADDLETGKSVAIKKVPDIAGDVSTAQRILRELKLLRCGPLSPPPAAPQPRPPDSALAAQPLPGPRKHHRHRERDDGAAEHAGLCRRLHSH